MKKAELIKENEMLKTALKRILEYSSNEHIDTIKAKGIESAYAYVTGEMQAVAKYALYDDTDIDIKAECI